MERIIEKIFNKSSDKESIYVLDCQYTDEEFMDVKIWKPKVAPKNIVSSGVSEKCLIQLAYAIGVSKPLSIFVKLAEGDEAKVKNIMEIIDQNFDLSPRGIREMLKLNNPIYQITSAFGNY